MKSYFSYKILFHGLRFILLLFNENVLENNENYVGCQTQVAGTWRGTYRIN